MPRLAPRAASLLGCLLLVACGGGGSASVEPPPPPPPTGGLGVAEILPAAADVRGGAQVTVVGSGFQTTNPPVLMRFGGRVVPVTPVSDTLIQVIVPPGDAVGNVPAGIISGSGLAELTGGFTYLPAPPAPPVLACLPGVGQAGTIIEMTVSNFAPLASPSVSIGNVPCTSITVVDDSTVRVRVPDLIPGNMSWSVVLSQGGSNVTMQGFYVQGTLSQGDLVINEFLADPGTGLDTNRDGTGSTTGDEFVEIVNRLGVAVDLTGWTLADAAGARHVFPNPTTVPAGGSLVVFGGGTPIFFAPPHASGHAQSATAGSLALNNTGSESIILRTPAGLVVAQVDYVQADVATGRSRTALTDGGPLSVPASSSSFTFHDLVSGSVGAASPGTKANGSGF